MTGKQPPNRTETSRFVSDEIELACDAFEAAWQRAVRLGEKAPPIESWIVPFSVADQQRLLRELLLLEWEYREAKGPPDVEEYVGRFPDAAELVRATYQEYRASSLSPDAVRPSSDADQCASSDDVLVATTRLRIAGLHREGGLGQVWVARDEEIGRSIAIKGIKPKFVDVPEVRWRFLQEAELTGQLEHPGIVPVYAIGQWPDGRPFYAMRLIRGQSLADLIRASRSEVEKGSPRQPWRLELHNLLRRFVDACNAIAYAHSRGILHRDLKPDNIMLGKYGETLVVDWGLAKTSAEDGSASSPEESVVGAALARDSGVSEAGLVLGTPAYMSPEQAAGKGDQVGPRTDIFGLGATLYCILTGQAPLGGRQAGEIIEQAKRGEYPPVRHLNPKVPRALAAICQKAMSWRPEDRYPTARDFAEDIERWLADESVTAVAETWRDRLGRWARRNRQWVTAGMVVLAFLAVSSFAGALVINGLRLRTEEARQETERHLRRASRALYATQLAGAARQAQTDPGACLELLTDTSACPEQLRDFGWHHLYRTCHREEHIWRAHADVVRLAAFARDSKTVVSVGADGTIKFWSLPAVDLQTKIEAGQPIVAAELSGDRQWLATAYRNGEICVWNCGKHEPAVQLPAPPTPVVRIALSQDGRRLAALCQGKDAPIIVWKVDSRERVAEFHAPPEATTLALSPDGSLLAAGGSLKASAEKPLLLWDVSRKQLVDCPQVAINKGLATRFSLRISCLAFDDAGENLFVGNDAGIVGIVNIAQRTCKQRGGHSGTVWAIQPGPHNSRVFFSAGVGTELRAGIHAPYRPVILWSMDRIEPLASLAGFTREVIGLDFHNESERLLATQKDGVLLVLDCAERWTHINLAQRARVDAVAWSAEGRVVAAGCDEQSCQLTLRQWDRNSGEEISVPEIELLNCVLVMPSGHVLRVGSEASSRRDGPSVLLDALSRRVIAQLQLADGEAVVAVSVDRTSAAVRDREHRLQIIDLRCPTSTAVLDTSNDTESLAVFSPSGKHLACTNSQKQGVVELWEVDQRRRIGQVDVSPGGVKTLAFSPDGRTLAVGQRALDLGLAKSGVRRVQPAAVTLTDVPSCKVRATLGGHAGDLCAIAFSPDGKVLATGGHDCKVRLWDVESCVPTVTLGSHSDWVISAAFAPDGQTLATAGYDQSIRVWQTAQPAFVTDREAWQLLHALDDVVPVPSDLAKRIREETTVPESVRQRALELLEQRGQERL